MRPPEFWRRDDGGARAMRAALAPLGWVYGASVAHKAARSRPHRAKARVICIGNLTLGGAGKTPVAIAVAHALIAAGRTPVFLSRGYGGKERGPVLVDPASMSAAWVGDEPLLLAQVAPAIVSRDRIAGAALADAQGFDCIVMDDGHQNFTLAKDLSLVVADAEAGFGNGGVFPAGPLREPVRQGLSRADAVVLVGDGAPDLAGFTGPVLRTRLTPAASAFAGQRVLAFAGIGRPEKFFATLRGTGAETIETRAFADHHAYTPSELARLRARAKALEAALVTTEKDYIRLEPAERAGIANLPIAARFDDENAFAALVTGAHKRDI